MVAVHQFVQSFVAHDAISTHARHLRRILTSMGIENEIWVGEKQPKEGGRSFREYEKGSDANDIALYHLSTGGPIPDYLDGLQRRLVVNYHNITPAHMYEPWEHHVSIELMVARRQLAQLSKHAELAIGVSAYNEAELIEVGYAKTSVAPVLFDPRDFERVADKRLAQQLAEKKAAGGADWLFVGRISPNKCQQDIIKAFVAYRKLYDENARLHLVGGISSHHYWTVLNKFVRELGLEDCIEFAGGVSNAALGAYYDNADVFVCMSEHEGFGVPLLEAMHNKIPLVAYAAAAVPETVGNSALLLDNKDAAYVASVVHRVVTDADVNKALIAAADKHLTQFDLSAAEDKWRATIEDLVRVQ